MAHDSTRFPLVLPALTKPDFAELNRMKDEFEHQLYYDRLNIADMTGYNAGAWLADTPRSVKGQKAVLWPKDAMLTLLERLAGQKELTERSEL